MVCLHSATCDGAITSRCIAQGHYGWCPECGKLVEAFLGCRTHRIKGDQLLKRDPKPPEPTKREKAAAERQARRRAREEREDRERQKGRKPGSVMKRARSSDEEREIKKRGRRRIIKLAVEYLIDLLDEEDLKRDDEEDRTVDADDATGT